MAERIVVNTGPLITLARADLLEVVGQIPLTFICPAQVAEEIAEGVSLGYPDVRPEWLSSMVLSKAVDPVAQAALDLGEAAVIALALEQNISRVCIDERKGRAAAAAVGLKVTGTLGLLARARTLGLIPALRPVLDRLVQVGAFYDQDLIGRLLEAFGE
jgi:predicted nucleic acid-binding protein